MDRISTGIKSLDYILNGGIPVGSSILIAGNPGTGKTILANQIIHNYASEKNKVLYLTTMSEPQIKIMKFQKEFSFFNIEKFQRDVLYFDVSSMLRKDKAEDSISYIYDLIEKYQPGLVVLDTIKTISEMVQAKSSFRKFFHDFTVHLAVWDCTSIILGEYNEKEIDERPECAIADGIIYLSGTEERKFQKRYMRILKMRGTCYKQGEIFFKINNDGINPYPRLDPDIKSFTFQNQTTQRVSTGVPGLDKMMDGGLIKSSVTILSGCSGTGKTLFSSSFAYNSLCNGETVIYATFEENPQQFISNALSAGMDLRQFMQSGKLILIYVPPIEFDLDEHIYTIQKLVYEKHPHSLIIDSISSFEVGIKDKIKYTDYIWSVTNYLKSKGVTTYITHELCNEIDNSELTKYGISFIADNILLLQFKEVGQNIRRQIRIVKARSVSHDMLIREYVISNNGISIVND